MKGKQTPELYLHIEWNQITPAVGIFTVTRFSFCPDHPPATAALLSLLFWPSFDASLYDFFFLQKTISLFFFFLTLFFH